MSASVFQFENYSGRSLTKAPPYENNNLSSVDLNDNISSYRVDPGVLLDVFQKDGFGGASATWTGSQAKDLGWWDATPSSLRIRKDCDHASWIWDPDCKANQRNLAFRKDYCKTNMEDEKCKIFCNENPTICDAVVPSYCSSRPGDINFCGCYNFTASVKSTIDKLRAAGTTLIPKCDISQCATNASAYKSKEMKDITCTPKSICIQTLNIGAIDQGSLGPVSFTCNQSTSGGSGGGGNTNQQNSNVGTPSTTTTTLAEQDAAKKKQYIMIGGGILFSIIFIVVIVLLV